jgi:hypothetical protein
MPGSSTTPGRPGARAHAPLRVAFRFRNGVGTRDMNLCEAQWLACVLPYRRFAAALTGDRARLGADVDRYSVIVSDLHQLLVAGLPAHCERFWTLSILVRDSPEKKASHGNVDHGFGDINALFVIAHEAAPAGHPGAAPMTGPSCWTKLCSRTSSSRLSGASKASLEQMFDPRPALADRMQDDLGARTVGDVRRNHQYTFCQGGKSLGSIRQPPPERAM